MDALAAFLTMLRLKRSAPEMEELSRRLNDKRSESWINLDDWKAM